MSDVQSAQQAAATRENVQRLTELRVSASMMQLDPGLYCVVLTPSPSADTASGLPGVRITPTPGPSGRPEAVRVRTLSDDGWMSGFGDASLIRVTGGPALVLVTIYQAPGSTAEGAPNLQVLPLMGEAPAQAAGASPAPLPAPAKVDVVAHIQTRGDVGAQFGEWLGKQGSGLWIEGFGITPPGGVALTDIEYQVVLGRGWMSPWVEGGQYCGSRGMALPILGLRIRLRGAAAEAFEIRYSASFVDGTTVGPVSGGEPCEADDLVAVEALFLELVPIGKSATEAAPKGRAGGKRR